jgi:hypothetical protein
MKKQLSPRTRTGHDLRADTRKTPSAGMERGVNEVLYRAGKRNKILPWWAMPTLRLASCADHRGAIRLDLVVSNATTRTLGSDRVGTAHQRLAYGTVEARPGGLRAYQPPLNELGFGHAPDDNKDGSASSAQKWKNVHSPSGGQCPPYADVGGGARPFHTGCFATAQIKEVRATLPKSFIPEIRLPTDPNPRWALCRQCR